MKHPFQEKAYADAGMAADWLKGLVKLAASPGGVAAGFDAMRLIEFGACVDTSWNGYTNAFRQQYTSLMVTYEGKSLALATMVAGLTGDAENRFLFEFRQNINELEAIGVAGTEWQAFMMKWFAAKYDVNPGWSPAVASRSLRLPAWRHFWYGFFMRMPAILPTQANAVLDVAARLGADPGTQQFKNLYLRRQFADRLHGHMESAIANGKGTVDLGPQDLPQGVTFFNGTVSCQAYGLCDYLSETLFDSKRIAGLVIEVAPPLSGNLTADAVMYKQDVVSASGIAWATALGQLLTRWLTTQLLYQAQIVAPQLIVRFASEANAGTFGILGTTKGDLHMDWQTANGPQPADYAAAWSKFTAALVAGATAEAANSTVVSANQIQGALVLHCRSGDKPDAQQKPPEGFPSVQPMQLPAWPAAFGAAPKRMYPFGGRPAGDEVKPMLPSADPNLKWLGADVYGFGKSPLLSAKAVANIAALVKGANLIVAELGMQWVSDATYTQFQNAQTTWANMTAADKGKVSDFHPWNAESMDCIDADKAGAKTDIFSPGPDQTLRWKPGSGLPGQKSGVFPATGKQAAMLALQDCSRGWWITAAYDALRAAWLEIWIADGKPAIAEKKARKFIVMWFEARNGDGNFSICPCWNAVSDGGYPSLPDLSFDDVRTRYERALSGDTWQTFLDGEFAGKPATLGDAEAAKLLSTLSGWKYKDGNKSS